MSGTDLSVVKSITTNYSSSYIAIFCTKEINTQQICVVADNISPEINYLSVVYRYLCIVYIISHLLEEMYENQILILLKFHVLPLKDKLVSASVNFGS